jgi:uncharacterized damage-inducible protein DinB
VLPEQFRLFAGYNAWANARLYDACSRLPREEYHRDRRAFFRSLHGTLNHLLLTDRIWLGRIEGRPVRFGGLDDELYADLHSLREARRREDARIVDLVGALGEEALADEVTYTNTSGNSFATPLWQVLAHLFNHQTHHRGQAHDMLSQTEVPPPPLDLIFFIRGLR